MTQQSPSDSDVPRANDGLLQIDTGARLWCNDDVKHHIDGELREVHVLFYEIDDVELYFEDLELWSRIELTAYDVNLEPLFTEQIGYNDLEAMTDMRNNGWAFPVSSTAEEMQSKAIEHYHSRSDQE